jgi:hypothetical protein
MNLSFTKELQGSVMKSIAVVGCAVTLLATAVPVAAQSRPARDAKYRIGQIERILEGAAEHGAKGAQELFKTMLPGDFLLTDDVHVRGFSIGDWGVFFDVQMPPLESTTPWIVSTLDQSGLDITNAMRNLMSIALSTPDPSARQVNVQSVERVTLQLGMTTSSIGTPTVATQTGQPQTLTAQAPTQTARQVEAASLVSEPTRVSRTSAPAPAADNNPQAAFHAEVKAAIIEAMLEHGASLRLRPEQRLMVAIRGVDNLPRLAPGEPESPTIQITISGADLLAFTAQQLSHDEVLKRIVIEEVP